MTSGASRLDPRQQVAHIREPATRLCPGLAQAFLDDRRADLVLVDHENGETLRVWAWESRGIGFRSAGAAFGSSNPLAIASSRADAWLFRPGGPFAALRVLWKHRPGSLDRPRKSFKFKIIRLLEQAGKNGEQFCMSPSLPWASPLRP